MFTTMSAAAFLGLCIGYIGSEYIPIGYIMMVTGIILSVISILVGDRGWIPKLSLALGLTIIAVAFFSFLWKFRDAGH